MEWWYHVALAYRVANEVYVLDPALEPHRPLKVAEWNFLIGGDKARPKYAICASETFDPSEDCYKPKAYDTDRAFAEQALFFDSEWDRLLKLQREPERELGDFHRGLLIKNCDRVFF